MGKPLTARAQRFVAELLKDPARNGTKAAIAAGYSPNGADVQAARLLSDPRVREGIDAVVAKASKRSLLTVERVQEEIARIAFSDPRKLVDDKGNLKLLHELDDDTAASIASIENEELFGGAGAEREHIGTLRKVKVWDKNKALDMAGRHLGMFKAEVDVRIGIGILVIHE